MSVELQESAEKIKEFLISHNLEKKAHTYTDLEGFLWPIWGNGHKWLGIRVWFLPYDDHCWLKFTAHLVGNPPEEWDTLFEGAVYSLEDVKTIFRLLDYPTK